MTLIYSGRFVQPRRRNLYAIHTLKAFIYKANSLLDEFEYIYNKIGFKYTVHNIYIGIKVWYTYFKIYGSWSAEHQRPTISGDELNNYELVS